MLRRSLTCLDAVDEIVHGSSPLPPGLWLLPGEFLVTDGVGPHRGVRSLHLIALVEKSTKFWSNLEEIPHPGDQLLRPRRSVLLLLAGPGLIKQGNWNRNKQLFLLTLFDSLSSISWEDFLWEDFLSEWVSFEAASLYPLQMAVRISEAFSLFSAEKTCEYLWRLGMSVVM